MRPKITFKRVTSPKEKDFQRLWKIYEECFPIRDERETRSHLLETASGYAKEDKGKYMESYLLSTCLNGKIVGGAVFEYAEGIVHGKKFSFGVDWYLFIEKECRMKGLGKRTHEGCLEILQEKAKQRNSPLDLIACEMNDLKRMKPQDREKDRKVIIDPGERMAFFSSLGYHEIDPSRFSYIQPQLTENTHPCRELMLAIKPIGKNFRSKIPIEYLKQLLWLYTWAGFDGIPKSNINGHRDPDTDKAYKEMENQLERTRKPLSLKPLVSGQEITIEPLSRKTLMPAIKLLEKVFPHEKESEIPHTSLRASLNPKPYRNKLAEWDILELRYWVALNKIGKVIGIVGLYSYNKDRKEAEWLGWFAVSPKYRRHGIGKKMIDFAIYNAKLSGKRYLRLYTSMHPNELESHRLYEERGFVKVREEDTPGWKGKKIVYEMGLKE